jgi:LmbE family N-acetylglucosaminyl deacetylase
MLMEKMLIIAPHADDAEFGLGGYLHRMARERRIATTVGVVAGGDYVGRDGVLVKGDVRQAETARALGILGVRTHVSLGWLKENNFDVAGRAAVIDAVDHLLGLDSFDHVLVCLPSHNQDHEALYRATLAAFRPGRWPGVKQIWAYEHPANGSWNTQPTTGRCYVSVSQEDMAAKVRALNEHASQFGSRKPNHDGPDGAMALARLRGSEIGVPYAEVFWLLREVLP